VLETGEQASHESTEGRRPMTSDPAKEAERLRQMRGLEQQARKQPRQPGQPPPDPVHVVRFRQRDGDLYALCRWSTAKKLIRGAAEAGDGGEIADLGPDAMRVAQAFDAATLEMPGGTLMVHVGLARYGRWLRWYLPVPPEPVPGTREWSAGRN
jgi:hypothetical protein